MTCLEAALDLDFGCEMICFTTVQVKGNPSFLLTPAGSILANVSFLFGYSNSILLGGQISMKANKLKSPYAGSSCEAILHYMVFYTKLETCLVLCQKFLNLRWGHLPESVIIPVK